MELHDFNNLLHKVKSDGHFLDFENDEDMASVHFVKSTGRFIFILNSKPLFSFKSLRHFRNKLIEKLESLKLTLIEP